MKDVKFIRINEDNINFIPDIIKIDDKDIQKKDIEKFIINCYNYCFAGICKNDTLQKNRVKI